MLSLLLVLALQSAMPPQPPVPGHTFTLDVQAPSREVAERYVIRVYIDGHASADVLAGVHCLPIVPTITAPIIASLYACTGDLPTLANGFHSLQHSVSNPGSIEGPKSDPFPFVYRAPAQAPPPGTHPRIP